MVPWLKGKTVFFKRKTLHWHPNISADYNYPCYTGINYRFQTDIDAKAKRRSKTTLPIYQYELVCYLTTTFLSYYTLAIDAC